jgi:hypothetical protein
MLAAEVIDALARAWNTEDDTERLRLLSSACLPDAHFLAPQGRTVGVKALSAGIKEFRRAFPAAVVSFGSPDGYGGFARVTWTTDWNNGQPPLTGEDFAHLAADGRIRLLVSFDGAPAATRLPEPHFRIHVPFLGSGVADADFRGGQWRHRCGMIIRDVRRGRGAGRPAW